MRRIPDRCYFCGDPTMGEWFCVEHVWALGVPGCVPGQLAEFTKEHAYWLDKLTPAQILDAAAYLSEAAA